MRPNKIFFIFIFLMVSYFLISRDYTYIDEYALRAPSTEDMESLVSYLIKPASDDFEKVRAIYFWITHNISYDVHAFFSNRILDTSAINVFYTRKIVCAGYANLFQEFCDIAGIECVTIIGFAKGYGYVAGMVPKKSNHAWNAVKIKGKWYLIDATWGSGYLNGNSFVFHYTNLYFLADPKIFINDHFPEEEKWQLLDKPIDKYQFALREPPARYIFWGKMYIDGNEEDIHIVPDEEERREKAINQTAWEISSGIFLKCGMTFFIKYLNNNFYSYYYGQDYQSSIQSHFSFGLDGDIFYYPFSFFGFGVNFQPACDLLLTYRYGYGEPNYILLSSRIKLATKFGDIYTRHFSLFEIGVNISRMYYLNPLCHGGSYSPNQDIRIVGPSIFLGYDNVKKNAFHYTVGFYYEALYFIDKEKKSDPTEAWSHTIGIEGRIGMGHLGKIKKR